jgi:hypothetical protein
VFCWKTVGVAFGERISYQRTPDGPLAVLSTEWVTTSDSWSPKLRYAKRYIRRSASDPRSCVEPSCGAQSLPPHAGLNAATGMFVGPTNVVLAGVAKSTCSFQRFRLFVSKSTMKFGEPAGGSAVPSRSDGRMPPCWAPTLKHCCVAAAPVSIFARSATQTSPPLNVCPFWKRLYVK